jgi:histidine triad (HIT) family protein
MDDCVFCKIIDKTQPASIIYEDDDVVVFLDTRPVRSGHCLVVPKEHYVNILDTPQDVVSKLFMAVQRTAKAVQKVTGADGISVFQNNGRSALQVIFHVHVHVVPRFENDGFRERYVELIRPIRIAPSRDELDDLAVKLGDEF